MEQQTINSALGGKKVHGLENKEEIKLRVLIADDEPAILMLVGSILRDQGYVVETAKNASELIEKLKIATAKNEKLDLMIIDNSMPKEDDGIKAISEIRNQGDDFANIPIIFFTGDDAKTAQEKIANAGVKDVHYLGKPFSMDRLVGTVDEILPNRKVERQAN